MAEELEVKLIKAYMGRNGWQYPVQDGAYEDYDMAVSDVKWFMARFKEAGYVMLAKDQRLPRVPYDCSNSIYHEGDGYHGGLDAQERMVKAGWQKVELEVKDNGQT